jgi:hypothetical protein
MMTRYETHIWKPEAFYPVNFGTDVIDELHDMSREIRFTRGRIQQYEQYKRDILEPAFRLSVPRMRTFIDEFEANPLASLPDEAQPLYEYARFRKGSRGIDHGLGTIGVSGPPGSNRHMRYVLAPLNGRGELNVERGDILWQPGPARLPAYILQRVGVCYLANE